MNENDFQLQVNGMEQRVRVPPMTRLLDVLRHDLRLTGTKEGCGEGECGSCSVLMNGELVNSCLVPIAHAAGASVITIEGVGTDQHLDPVQQAFLECGGAQCGICTPGMVLATLHLLERYPTPTEAQTREGLNGNLCRCTGYIRIFDAVTRAATVCKENRLADAGRTEAVLNAWHHADLQTAAEEILPCCGSRAWAESLAKARPFASVAALQQASDAIWFNLGLADWQEAFGSHPRIGETKAPVGTTGRSAAWSREEQRAVASADNDILQRLAEGNAAYERRYGRTYIVCATGNSAAEMLAMLESRLQHDEEQELREAVEQQSRITQVRLKKWLLR